MRYTQAIITGASSGFGKEFARRLAGTCHRLVLVARREAVLKALADELHAAHEGLEVLVEPCDLSAPDQRRDLEKRLALLPDGSTLLVNNAGLGDYGEFSTSTPERNNALLQVNILAVVELTRAVLPRLKDQGGGIINISSLAADLPIPDFALYAASKAFVASFSEALRLELKKEGLPVACICPGPVHTEFGDVARREGLSDGKSMFRSGVYTTIPTVVDSALKAVEKGRARTYPSFKIRMAGLLLRNLPLWLMRAIMGMRPRKTKQLPH